MSKTAAIVGGGPAGLMAAEILAQAGARVTVYDAKPSMGRKFLMAGKSGLNLTMNAPLADLTAQYFEAAPRLAPIVAEFDAEAIQGWARGLEQPLFTGSSGRVFPEAMKASPLLRAWFARLDALGVVRETRARWQGWNEDGALVFGTPDGPKAVTADVTILALGGGSWARLGSDGAWADVLAARGVDVAPFGAANVGVAVDWSPHMERHFGAAIKAVRWSVAGQDSRGEAILSQHGLEGGGLYPLARLMRDGAPLHVDLMPDLSAEDVIARLSKPRGKATVSNHLRKVLKLTPAKLVLLQEWAQPVPQDPAILAALIKNLPARHSGLRPLDQAISTSGGVMWGALDASLMLNAVPDTYCAGEMLDWEAPTGGYLLTACFATGRWAGMAAARSLGILA